MRVMLVSFFFPPDPAIGSVRAGALRQELTEMGHEVTVVCGSRPEVAASDSAAVLRTDWFDFAHLRRVSSPIQPPPAPTAAPPSVMLPSPSTRLPGPLSRFTKSLKAVGRPGSLPRRHLATARGNIVEVPDQMLGWIKPAVRAGVAVGEEKDFDVLVASGPPHSCYLVGARIAKRLDIPWIADYRDLWTNSSYYTNSSWRHAVDRAIERRAIATAALTTTVSQPLADDMVRDFGVRSEVIMNGFDEVQVPSFRRRVPLSSARLNIAFVGENFYGGKRSPARVFQAAKAMNLSPDQVRFHFLGTDVQFVSELASSIKVNELVQFHPRVSRDESLAFQARADALLLLMDDSPKDMGVYTSKIFEYMSVRRPILLSGFDGSVAADLVRRHSLGIVVNTDQDAAAAVGSMLRSKPGSALLPDLPPPPHEYSRQTQCRRMIELISEAAGNG